MAKSAKRGAIRLLFALTLAVFVCLQAHVAIAEPSVTGMDYYYGGGEPNSTVDILSVSGKLGDTVFVRMTQGDRIIADHLAFTLGKDNAEAQGDLYVGVASAAMADYNPSTTYTVSVYQDRAQSEDKLIYTGTVNPVYAQIEGRSTPQLIALRTIGSETRAFSAPGSITVDGVTYELKDNAAVSEAPLTYAYKLGDNAQTVDGSITYVDDEGKVLSTEKIEGLALNTSKKVSVPNVITAGEGSNVSFWRTVCFGGSVEVAYPGTKDVVIPCKPLEIKGGGNVGNHYFATIELADEEGNRLATDTLNVTGVYRYTAPARLHITGANGLVSTYVLDGSDARQYANGVLSLDPATDEVTTGAANYTIRYKKLPSDAEATWTITLVNGAADPKAKNRIISTETKAVKPGETATYAPKTQLEVEGQTFVAANTTKDEYSFAYGSGQSPMLTVYYVPDGYEAPEPYDIQVRYVNIANQEVLQTKTYTSRPELRDELEITSPETFSQNGEEYVRLDGQEQSVWHSYYSSARVYTIYYRNVKDELSANVVITRINVEYVDGATTVTDNGTTTTNGGTTTTNAGTTTTNGGTTTTDGGTTTTDGGTTGDVTTGTVGGTGAVADDGVPNAAIPANTDGGLTVINGDDNSLVTDGEGRDTNTMRIEDDATPMAGPSEGASQGLKNPAVIGGVIAATVAAVGLLLYFVVFKRRKQQAEQTEDAE